MKILDPTPLPFDLAEWRKQPYQIRIKMLCQAWATQGFGAPIGAYIFYLLKILIYIGGWFFFCSMSDNLGGPSSFTAWYFEPEALAKALAWSIVYEVLGLGCGSGPLTGRYNPPIGAFLHYLRPGTIKLPLFPGIPLLGGDKRRWLEVVLYIGVISALVLFLFHTGINTAYIYYAIGGIVLLTLSDKTTFLASRGEHYIIALICFLFPADMLAGNKLVWLAIWIWAATSKLNHHFPAVVAVMISNHGIIRWEWLKKQVYKNYPNDLNPSRFTQFLAHTGTVWEYTFPLLLLFGDGGTLTFVALMMMLAFHTFITSSIPMGVPLEWNVIMVYGAFVLFGAHYNIWAFSIESPLLISLLVTTLLVLPILGNLFPRFFSFLVSMRYYAGNWAYSIWLFKGDVEEKMDQYITKAAPILSKQIEPFYDELTSYSLLQKVATFRAMHLHGRAFHNLVEKAVDNVESYVWRDGENVAGLCLGWNFGEGHLHDEQLLSSIQKRCSFKSGELRCIMVESQPFGRPYHDWRIVDAKDGQLSSGRIQVSELLKRQPWPAST